jgi:hypothetical protein
VGRCLVLISLAIGACCASLMADAHGLETIAALRSGSAQAIETLQMQYSLDFNRQTERGSITDLHATFIYAAKGAKRYQSERFSPTHAGEKAFDGLEFRSRTRPNTLVIHKPAVDETLLGELPSELIEPELPERLAQGISDKRFALLEEKRENLGSHACLKLTFDAKLSGKKLAIWYDLGRGGWPIQRTVTEPNGAMVDEVREVQLEKIIVDGNELYFPAHGMRVWYQASKEIRRNTCEVLPGTLKVNQPIADSLFVLQPKPNEKVFDYAAKKFLNGPVETEATARAADGPNRANIRMQRGSDGEGIALPWYKSNWWWVICPAAAVALWLVSKRWGNRRSFLVPPTR